MPPQFDDVVKDAKRSAKEEIAEYLKRQNGSSSVIDKLIKAVVDIHQNKQLDEPNSSSSYSAALSDLATICWRGPRRHNPAESSPFLALSRRSSRVCCQS
jgi:hypothetical protein